MFPKKLLAMSKNVFMTNCLAKYTTILDKYLKVLQKLSFPKNKVNQETSLEVILKARFSLSILFF